MMKKILCCLAAAVMMMTMAGAALASAGDRMIHQAGVGGMAMSAMIQQVIRMDRRVYLYLRGGENSIDVYDLDSGESTSYDLTELEDQMNGLTESQAKTEEEEPVQESIGLFFGWNGELYAVVNRTEGTSRQNRLDGGHVRKLVLEDGKVSLQECEIPQLDWTNMTERDGRQEFSRYVSSQAVTGQWLAIACYGDSGNALLELFDLTTGENIERELEDLNEVGPGPDGKLMISRYKWGENSYMIVSLYDPQSEEEEELARFNLEDSYPRAVAWQKETDTLYYVTNGEIFAAPGRDLTAAQSVNECSISSSTNLTQLTEDGFMLVCGYDSAALKNTDPSKRGQVTLRIRPFAWTDGMDESYYAFSAERGDVSVVREDYGDESTLLASMMNRDDQVDLYVIGLSTNAFGAMMDRGFLTDLSGSEKLVSEVQKMYPAFREAVEKDGKLMALPVQISGEGLGYNEKVWEKLGLTEAELPRTWNQLLDLLETLPDKLEGTEFRAFSLFFTQQDIRRGLASSVMLQYSLMRPDAGFNTPELQQLMDRISRLNLGGLDVLTDEESESINDRYEELGGNKEALLSLYTSMAVAGYYENYQALALRFEEGEAPILPAEMTVAFINPFSQHLPEAMAYLESMSAHPSIRTAYSLYPDRNEPVRYPNYERQKRTLEKYLEQARQKESADDPDDETNWHQVAEDYENQLRELEEDYWVVGPKELAAYRERAELLAPIGWNFWNQLFREDGGAAFSEIWDAYLNGQKPAAELLAYVDQKVRMMRMEGN